MLKPTSFDIEDVEALLKELQNFLDTLQDEWPKVLTQWSNLKVTWLDEQYYKFEALFENLVSTYLSAKGECEIYIKFLQQQIDVAKKQRFNLLQGLEKPIAIAQLGASLFGMNASPQTQTSPTEYQNPNSSYIQEEKANLSSLDYQSDPETSPEVQKYNSQPAIFRSMSVEDQLNEAFPQEREKEVERRKKQAKDSAGATNSPIPSGSPPPDNSR